MALWRFESTSSLAMTALPANSSASASTCGAMILHGPHQVAQKSTMAGLSLLITVDSKVASVTWETFPPIVCVLSFPFGGRGAAGHRGVCPLAQPPHPYVDTCGGVFRIPAPTTP